jgi:N6-adenosine-specific RNA methylase IME4
MSLEAIKHLPIEPLCAPDATLFLWCYTPSLDKAFEVIKSWGFTYTSTAFVWAKCEAHDPTRFRPGLGFTTRKQTELCLLAKRGHPKRLHSDVEELIVAPRRQHSMKPDEAYERIDRLYDGPALELFARKNRPGWDAWGAEAGMLDSGPVRTRRIASTPGSPDAVSAASAIRREVEKPRTILDHRDALAELINFDDLTAAIIEPLVEDYGMTPRWAREDGVTICDFESDVMRKDGTSATVACKRAHLEQHERNDAETDEELEWFRIEAEFEIDGARYRLVKTNSEETVVRLDLHRVA